MSEGLRFKELQRTLGISARMLSKELKDLEMNQLVHRETFDTAPITVEYSLTAYGESLCPVIRGVVHVGRESPKAHISRSLAATAFLFKNKKSYVGNIQVKIATSAFDV